jgi:hypothetical protein
MTNGDRYELGNKLDGVARPECPSCRRSEWLREADGNSLMLPTIINNRVDPGHGMEAFILICEACGFIRMHSVEILQGMD